jgi:hypothetical protein
LGKLDELNMSAAIRKHAARQDFSTRIANNVCSLLAQENVFSQLETATLNKNVTVYPRANSTGLC